MEKETWDEETFHYHRLTNSKCLGDIEHLDALSEHLIKGASNKWNSGIRMAFCLRYGIRFDLAKCFTSQYCSSLWAGLVCIEVYISSEKKADENCLQGEQ
ncbi:hypothetical protein ACH3XW_15770 [Acanthocheilonema viteae]